MHEDIRDPRKLARAATGALIIFAVVDVIFSAGQLYAISAIDGFLAKTVDLSALERSDQVGAVTGIANIVTMLVCGIIVARWIYRTNKNAHLFDRGTMTVSPGWSVGWFFVPVASLFVPFRGVRETFQVSADPHAPENVPIPPVMRIWWASWLVQSCLGQASFRLSLRAETLEQLRLVAQINFISIVPDLAAAGSLIWLIRTVTDNQLRNFVLPATMDEEEVVGDPSAA